MTTAYCAMAGLLYLGCVLLAFDFFGTLVLRRLAPAVARDHGMAIAFGVACFLAYTAWLELTATAGRATLLAPVLIGVIGAITTAVRSNRLRLPARAALWPSGGWGTTVLLGVFTLLLVLFLINAADWSYGFVDDRHGYLAFPERILGEGSAGRDLFQFRRIEAGLSAGGAYLYALFRAALDLRQTRLADLGVGSICLLLLVAGHARTYGVSTGRLAAILLATLGVIVWSPLINNTPDTIGKALLYALLRLTLALAASPPTLRRGAAMALMVVAIVSLKTSYLPTAAAAIAAFYLFAAMQAGPLRLVPEIAVAAAVAFGLTLPWMIVCEHIAGTPWYPILGLGTLRPEETTGIVAATRFATEAGRLMVLLALPALVAIAAWRSPEWLQQRWLLVFLVVCATALTLLTQLKFSLFGYRYGQMGPATLLLLFLVIALRCRLTPLWSGALLGSLALALAIMALSKSTERSWIDDGAIAEAIVGKRPGDSADWRDDRQAEYLAMQQAVPAGQPIAVMLSWPSLLDFRRNPIMVMDWPAMMGPPGMPHPDDAEGWSAYLIRNDIRYVAYSYGDEAGYSKTRVAHDIARFSRPASYSLYQVTLATRTAQMHDTFLALRSLGTVVYDDGKQFVVQLPGR